MSKFDLSPILKEQDPQLGTRNPYFNHPSPPPSNREGDLVAVWPEAGQGVDRSLVTSPQKSESDGQLQQLRQENEKLCRLLAKLQGDQDERDRRIATLEQQNREYRENDKEHKRLITRIANTFSDTFHDYQASLSRTNKEQVSQKATGVKDVRIGYEEVISAWSDYSSS
ncbi:hypothetical protein DL771_009396 [Monosporascus sp. 5C6A]|nr:hypothetical protein DL771_009396 [Monosporascus sp. 5C6A]